MLMRCKQIPRKVLRGSSGGATLVEVVIAVLVLAILVGSVPAAMIAVSNAHFRANQIRIAENLTRNEFEFIKSQDYKLGNVTYPLVGENGYEIIPVDASFGLKVDAWPIYPGNGTEVEKITTGDETDPGPTLYKYDFGIQLITVTAYGFGQRTEQSKTLLVSTNYKVAR
jgi:type II secretory pathway pseudopilin PulG